MCISEVEESSLEKVKGTSQRVGVGEGQEGKVVVGEDVFLSAVVNNMTRSNLRKRGFISSCTLQHGHLGSQSRILKQILWKSAT